MKQASVQAHAKINLTLDVTGRRENGYHDVCMVMQSIGIYDTVSVRIGTGEGISLHTSRNDLPDDPTNLAYRAAKLFLEQTQTACDGIVIEIEKNIPMAAGLAGGSTDAAAVLVLLNALYETGLTEQQLMDMGVKLGADVPFCIAGGTMLAEGIGEKLTRLPNAPQYHVVLCKPQAAVSTPAIYKAIDSAEILQRPDNHAMQQAIAEGNAKQVAQLLCNVMQPITAGWHPEIDRICDTMKQNGAWNAMMSGSGPSVFGLFDDKQKAQAVYERLSKEFAETFLTDFSQAGQIKA